MSQIMTVGHCTVRGCKGNIIEVIDFAPYKSSVFTHTKTHRKNPISKVRVEKKRRYCDTCKMPYLPPAKKTKVNQIDPNPPLNAA